MEIQRKTQFKEEGMVEGKEEENTKHSCSWGFILWVQGEAGGAEDWYWYSSMELNAPGKRQFYQSSPLFQLAQIWMAVSLLRRRYCSIKWKMLKNAGARRIPLEDCIFFLLGNSLIILHEVMIFEIWLVTLVSIKYWKHALMICCSIHFWKWNVIC